VSSKALQDRLVSVLTKPRAVMRAGDYYGPRPRKLAASVHADNEQTTIRQSPSCSW
jgi:hypothetical protein